MEKRPNYLILACLGISALSVLFVLFSRGREPQKPLYTPPPVKAGSSPETSVTSPDGKWTITMKEEKKEKLTYVFSVEGPTGSRQEIYRNSLPRDAKMSIPANAFSPDDKYVFLKEEGADITKYTVLSVSGNPITKDTRTFEIASLFTAKNENYKITDVTGWGGVNLIVFNTDKAEGGTGPSFWFEIPSAAFIQLSNRFN